MGFLVFILIVALVICMFIIGHYSVESKTSYRKARNKAIETVGQEMQQQISELKSRRAESSKLLKEITEKKKELVALEKEVKLLEEEKKPNRTRFTEFFEAVQKQYGNNSFFPKWHADAFVSLFVFYVNHYEEIEKKLSSFALSLHKKNC